MKNKKYIIIACLLLYVIIMILPPLIHGYVYPNGGDDTAYHLKYFESLKTDEGGKMLYLGRVMVGYPLLWFSDTFNLSIDALFLWFNYIALTGVGLAVYLLVSNLTDWKAGLVSLPLVMFCTVSTLRLFNTGAIFDLITIGIFLPISLLFVVKAITTRNKYYIIGTALMGILTIAFHLAIPPSVLFGIPSFIEPVIPTMMLVIQMIGVTTLICLLGAGVIVAMKRKVIKPHIILLIIMGIVIIVALVLVYSGITSYSHRLAIDLSIIIGILAAFMVGVANRVMKGNTFIVLVAVLVMATTIPQIVGYYHNNSALKQIDLEAIEYVNGLEGDYFSCSSEIAPWIYERYLDKTYQVGASPYIVRNQYMTYQTNPDSPYFWFEDYTDHDGRVIGIFKEGDVEIYIVEY